MEHFKQLSRGERRLLFELAPLPKTQMRFFLFCATTDAACKTIFDTIIN